MKYILLIMLLATTACCTPGTCPQEDIYITAVMQDGSESLVKIPKGALNSNEAYMTEKEFQEWIKQHHGI